MAELLINKGAKVNPAKSPSPLMGAVRDGHTQVVKVLLDYKAQVHGPPKASKTPLHLAAEKGYPQIAELLIEHNASPNRKDRTGNTPLYYATYNDHTQVMRMLIEAKGDVNQKIREGTLLHLAAQRGSGEKGKRGSEPAAAQTWCQAGGEKCQRSQTSGCGDQQWKSRNCRHDYSGDDQTKRGWKIGNPHWKTKRGWKIGNPHWKEKGSPI
jgi:hypothetical protein